MRTIWAMVRGYAENHDPNKKAELVTLADGTYWVHWTEHDGKLEGSIHFFYQQDRYSLTVTDERSIKILKGNDWSIDVTKQAKA